MKYGRTKILNSYSENWKIKLIDTGIDTMTGGRLKKITPYLKEEPFFLTYGDGLSNIDITAELEFHKASKKLVTITAVRPPGRFGVLTINDSNVVSSFEEKPKDQNGWINGGFFVVEPRALKYISHDYTSWETSL